MRAVSSDEQAHSTPDLSDDESEEDYDMEDHRRLLLEHIEEDRFDQLALIDKILLDLAFMLAEDSEACAANIKLNKYFENLDVSQPYRFRIREATLLLEMGITYVSDSDKWKPHLLSGLSLSYKLLFGDSCQFEDIESAVIFGEQALHLAPVGNASLPGILDILGGVYTARFDHRGQPSDIHTAIEHRLKAVKLAPNDHKERATFLTNLGASMTTRSLHSGTINDLDDAIEYLSQAILITPENHSNLPGRLNNMGIALNARFDRLGRVSDVITAIQHQTQALSLLTGEHLDRPMVLSNLGSSYLSRYRRFEDPIDLESAVLHLTKAVELAAANSPSDRSPDTAAWLHNLGTGLQYRFERQGRLTDIDKSIECLHDAVLRTQGHRWHSGHLVGLGTAYAIRYVHLKNVDDIDSSIHWYRQALLLVPTEDFSKGTLLNNLGNALFRRFEQFKSLDDINDSISCYLQAAALIPDEHTIKLSFLSNLGQAYTKRFEFQQQLEDLEEAIAYLSKTVSLTPDNHASKRSHLMLLATSLHLNFKHKQVKDDLDVCLMYASKALSLTPHEHIDRLETLHYLGEFYRTEFEYSHDFAAINMSISHLQDALSCTLGRPSTRFHAAWSLCISLRIAGLKDLLVSVYTQAMELLPQVVWLGVDIPSRYNNLLDVCEIAVEAAAAAIEASDIVLALEWLEAGSSIVWKQMNQFRTPFGQLQDQHPHIAQHLEAIARQLNNDTLQAPAAGNIQETELRAERTIQRRHRLTEEWEQLLQQVRLLPGYADFLCSKKAVDLMSAAQDGDIVVINVHQSRCDALILSSSKEDLIHLALPNFSYQKAMDGKRQPQTFLRGSTARSRGIRNSRPLPNQDIVNLLGLLWETVVRPVVNRLGYLHCQANALPHVAWCLTGPLAFLPLHAAGQYTNGGEKAFEFIVSSYIPTPSIALEATSHTGASNGILAVAQPCAPGFEAIPATVRELSEIKRHIGRKMTFTKLMGEQATADAVLDEMQKYSWVHFACHATQDPIDPLDSCFHLYESELNLSAIMNTDLRHATFAFLSACQTAMGDENLAEQAVHLAGGMVVAGYSSVIATMWSIDDQDGPEVAEKVYAYMLEAGVADSRKAARALHYAVGHLRDQIGEQEFARWIPFIHIGS